MSWQELAPFDVAHLYQPGQAPADEHPPAWGKLELQRYGVLDGTALVVRSTRRRKDGWSYNVAEERDRPAWVGYYHHKPTGRRLRAANSGNALELAQLLGAL